MSYLELLTPENMQLIESTKNEVTRDKNGEKIPHIKVTEVLLVHYNTVNNDYQNDSKSLVYICSE